ncbi:Non-specific serine/threonine protein kinase [Pyrolobus fumarii 1A]|uniref:non-specific serine/threonine protein kinase n=1 Tax=Pyrolobus fumarii (strain DSM 11204 / 1A) TaxID=694429 RepID=G0EDK4_PYRF1|nr:serine protein kinase RIO [Pyrolobus fumarii]AEM39808.1 Non-specific serine/threonine protein kinase [Pyrolobus fumarii 1A]
MAAYEVMRRLKLDRFAGVVSAGKEARVYRAVGRDGKEYAVKIYLTATAEFRRSIYKYIMGDPRFEGVDLSNTKRLFFAWARKEFRNLKRMYEAGVQVPKPYLVYQNIIVMEFIGREGKRAPLIKEVYKELDEEELVNVFNQVFENMKRIYCCARLVHADLSEYNIMYLDGKIYIIDVAQAVDLNHPLAMEFLKHDVETIHAFFADEAGLDIPSPEEMIREITECKNVQCVKRRVDE